MCETYKEQRPLLCDDLSEEDHFGPEYSRHYRPMIYRGRARTNAKGAAAIITRWPEHWSSSLSHWWIGLSMIAITIFIIYNGVIAFALLPPNNLKPTRVPTVSKIPFKGAVSVPDVIMHTFVNSNDELDLNNLIPYIEVISNKYTGFKYNLLVVINDTESDSYTLSAEQHNEIALKSLWSDQNMVEKYHYKNRINVERVSLTKHLDSSPLRKNWRQLPIQFIEFLVRAISIWDKGGISFDPIILTPQTPNVIYLEKLESILKNYGSNQEGRIDESLVKNIFYKPKENKNKKIVNNIRDIIENLEHDDSSLNSSQDNLSEVENRLTVSRNGRKLLSTTTTENKHELILEPTNFNAPHIKIRSNKNNDTEYITDKYLNIRNEYKSHEELESAKFAQDTSEITAQILETNKSSKFNLLPLFLEFLFHEKPKMNVPKVKVDDNLSPTSIRQRKSILPIDILKLNTSQIDSTNGTEVKNIENYKPMIILAKSLPIEVEHKNNESNEIPKAVEKDQLTIDLRGNILATETSCHAFLGTIFTNAIHHYGTETVKDFIIEELSYFCKGLLSSCRGIEVILV